MAKKPQTEEKAKGLLKNVGNYKGKTLNLSKKQLGASGRAAAATRKIAISRTTYDPATKKVLGPMGKPITGRVDLGGGNIAVYKNGVRVKAQKPAPKAQGGGGGGTKKEKSAAEKAGAGRKYEERKGTVGGDARRSRKTPMTSPNAMDRRDKRPELGPSKAGRTRPLPGVTERERQINANPRNRLYPNKKVTKAQEEALDQALLIASMLPIAGGAGRAAMALRGASAAKKAAAARAAARAAANRNTVVGAQARNAATRGLPSSAKRQALPPGRK